MLTQKILVVDDDETFCQILARNLVREGYFADTACNTDIALDKLVKDGFDSAVVDLRIGEESGLTLVKQMQIRSPHTRIVMLTGYASIATAVEARRGGGYHCCLSQGKG